MLRNKDMRPTVFPGDINNRTAFFSISCHGFVHIVCCSRFVRTPKMLPFGSFANILPLFCNIVYTLNARQRLNINTTPSCFIGIYATLAVVFPFSIPSGDEIRIYRLQILFAGVLSFDPLGADHFCLAGIPVFPCNPVLRSPFEAMAEIPERLLYLRGVGPRTDYQFRTILRKTGLAGCRTEHHPGRFSGFCDLRCVGVGQLSGQLLRASVFDDLLIPGVTPLVVCGFPLFLSSGAVFLPALLFCSSGRFRGRLALRELWFLQMGD